MYNIILKLATQFEKMAVSRLVTYHGTNAMNLPSIARKGLQAFKPTDSTLTQRGVYLTNNIQAAARYATSRYGSSEYPVVLELLIASPRHVKKITLDPLDDESDMYEQVDWSPWDDSVQQLERTIKDVLGLERLSPINIEPDIDNLNGMEIYRMILDFAKKRGLDIQKIKNKLREEMPPGEDFGDFEISESGTLKLTQQAYDSMHQMIYPKSLPSVSIKAIWIPEKVLNPNFKSLAVEQTKFGSKLLAGEIADISNFFRNAHVWNADALPAAMESIRNMYAVTSGYVDISELENAAKEGDVDSFNNILDWIAFEEFSNFDTVVNEQKWFKFNIGGKLTVNNAIKLYKE